MTIANLPLTLAKVAMVKAPPRQNPVTPTLGEPVWSNIKLVINPNYEIEDWRWSFPPWQNKEIGWGVDLYSSSKFYDSWFLHDKQRYVVKIRTDQILN
jgi:hypothetical protein